MLFHRVREIRILDFRESIEPFLYRDSVKRVIGHGVVHELRFVNSLLFASEERPFHSLVHFEDMSIFIDLAVQALEVPSQLLRHGELDSKFLKGVASIQKALDLHPGELPGA
jgi:hypothetical protein